MSLNLFVAGGRVNRAGEILEKANENAKIQADRG
jgi:hypothetical protein